MKRSVMGNDPFKRGTAARADVPAGPSHAAPSPELVPPSSAPGPTRAGPRPSTPVKLRPAPKGPRGARRPDPLPTPQEQAPRIVDLRPHAGLPVYPRPSGPRAHPGAPSLTGLAAHAGSPLAFELPPGVPVAHRAAPMLANTEAHGGSPQAIELLPGVPVAHPDAPRLRVDRDPSPRPALTPRSPRAHAHSPTAFELEVGVPVPHPAAPELEDEAPEPQAPHAAPPSLAAASERETPPAPAPPPAEPRRAPPTEPSPLSLESLASTARGLVRAARAALSTPARGKVDRWGKDAELTHLLKPLADLLYDKYWRVRVEGAAQVPSGPCIIVANHGGALPLSGPVLHMALRRERPELLESCWLLEDHVFQAPLIGALSNRLGAVRATPENALRLLDEGRPVIVFPEGLHGVSRPWAERYHLRRFGRGGYLKIALKAKVPVVPTAIVGSEEASPLLGRIPAGPLGIPSLPLTLPPLPSRWQVRFLAPLDFADAPATPDDDPAWVQRTNDEIRDAIQATLASMLDERL